MKNKISLSYVVPFYNEAAILADTIEVFIQGLEGLSDVVSEFELILVDDHSEDGSYEIAVDCAKDDDRIKVIRHDRNMGVGYGILTGLAASKMEWLSINCADRPFDIKDVRKCAELFETNDLIVVSRDIWTRDSKYRTLTSWVNYCLIRAIFGVKARDYQFIQFYRTSLLRSQNIVSRGTLVPPEMIIRMKRAGARTSETVAKLYKRGGGRAKYGHPKHVMKALCDMAKLRLVLIAESMGFAGKDVKREVSDEV